MMHDHEAEIAVLAASIVSATARDEARRHITGSDFDDPAHETIWDAMALLDRSHRHVDPTTVLATVRADRGATQRLPEIVSSGNVVPENVAEYAAIVRGWAIKRRLDNLSRRVQQQVANPSTNAHTLAAVVATEFAKVRDSGITEDVTSLTMAEVLATEDDEPDWLIPGLLEQRDRFILTGEEGLGKALAVDTPIPTTDGWVTLGDIRPGVYVFGPDGNPTRVVAVTGVMHQRPCYRVNFSDGTAIVADANHLWKTRDYKARQPRAFTVRTTPLKARGTDQRHKRTGYEPRVHTTEEIAATILARRGPDVLNHSIDTTAPLQYPLADLLIDPYVLGAWLGDGSTTSAHITTHPDDAEILHRIADTWPVRPTRNRYLWGIGDGTGKGKREHNDFRRLPAGAGCVRREAHPACIPPRQR